MFTQSEIAFEPGLFANRSKRSSKRRWVDGNFVRFRDDVPEQIGGWRSIPAVGVPIAGRPCGIISWRPNNQLGKNCAIGTHSHCFLFDGGAITDISPVGLVAGRIDAIPGAGFGVGLFGDDNFGTERSVTGQVLAATSWSFDMFGELLLGNQVSDGRIFQYLAGTDPRLIPLPNAPRARAICVSSERHVFAFGVDDNPRLVQWSDRENPSVWAPLATNRAGSYEMQISSPFQCGFRVRGSVVAWTETDVVMFFPSFNATVYGRDTLSESIGACGPRSVCVVNDSSGEMAIWMAVDGIYLYDGIVRRMPCPLHDFIYDDINLQQRSKFDVSTNLEFSEIRFSYCSADSNEINRCVTLCLSNGSWSKAHIERTVWLDRKVFAKPIALNATGTLFEHEFGDRANGVNMASYVLSHPMVDRVGQHFTDIGSFWPDMEELSGAVDVSLITRDYPGDVDLVHGPLRCERTAEKVDFYVSARQYQLRIAGTGQHWEIGLPLIETQRGGLA